MRQIDYNSLIGCKYNRLTITGYGQPKLRTDGRKHVTADYICDCGKLGNTVLYMITSGHTKSCGCLQSIAARSNRTSHGMSYHPLYQIYESMIGRCYDKKNIAYCNYGMRGITVYAEWRLDKAKFFKWALDNGWQRGLELDRENNNLSYSPDNCRFVRRLINARNKRNNRLIPYMGKTCTLSEWCEQLSLTYSVVLRRLIRGWAVEMAFEKPLGHRLTNLERKRAEHDKELNATIVE